MFYISLGCNILLLILLIFRILFHQKQNPERDITARLNQLDSIEREVKELNSIFTLPYLRGDAGETLLKELLANYLPKESFSTQYGFKNGSRVDAIIKTGKYIIPIDSKFPVQSVEETLSSGTPLSKNVIRTFLKHGEDISKKYINPTEGTLNFAVMYIPSEKIYYNAFISGGGELTAELLKIGVLPSGPSSLFSLVQTVVYGLKGFTFNQKQGEIMEKIEAIRVNYNRISKQFQITNSHIKNLKQSLTLCEKLIEEGEDLIPE